MPNSMETGDMLRKRSKGEGGSESAKWFLRPLIPGMHRVQ